MMQSLSSHPRERSLPQDLLPLIPPLTFIQGNMRLQIYVKESPPSQAATPCSSKALRIPFVVEGWERMSLGYVSSPETYALSKNILKKP
jgi:hypothetical protein